MAVELIDNLIKSTGGIIMAIVHRVVNAVAGVTGCIVIRGVGVTVAGSVGGKFISRGMEGLGLARPGSSYRGPRFRVPFRVRVINAVLGCGGGGCGGCRLMLS